MPASHTATVGGSVHPSQPPNLTREQASTRSRLLSVDSYRVILNLTDGRGGPGEKTYATRSEISFRATRGSSTFLDFVGEGIASTTLNGREVDVSDWSNGLGLALSDLDVDNELVVQAIGVYTNTGEGLHRFTDPVDGAVYLYSQFETADAKRLFPCFDQPDLKATFTFTVTAPADWQVVSNGATVTVDQSADAGGPRVHHFATTSPISTYITALIAGPYHVVSDSHDGIDLRLFCRGTLAEHLDSDRLFTETKQGFDFFHQAFGVRYPFGKYDQLFVPEFNAGAMENAGAVTFREEYVFRSRVTHYLYERRCETILHEMAHMWFGDLVTMAWWDDLWLNESFATWAAVVAQNSATEYTNAWTTFANVEKSWAYVQDQLPSTHPIAADMVDLAAVEVNFDGITYAKGASVLKQMAAYVGFDEFLAGLGSYFRSFAFGNATLADLMVHLTAASGRDLSGWTTQWLQTTGINELYADFDVAPDGSYSRFDVVQGGAAPGAGEFRTHRLAVGIYRNDTDGRLVRTERVELDVAGERTAVAGIIGVAAGDLVLVNDDDLTYCKLSLDERSLGTAISRIGDLTDSLPRTLLWSAVWEMTRDARMRARDFVALALTGVLREDQIGVVQRVLSQMQLAVGAYADPQWANSVGWPTVTAALLELATTSGPGSDEQLAAVQALASSKLSKEHVDTVAGWRDGSAPLSGLTVDLDLSWTLLNALVAHGAAGTAEIEAAAAADPTASGDRRAMTAKALLPDAESKAAIWQRLIEDDGMANALQDAAISGFAHPAQTDLLAGYPEKYFAVVDEVWARRSNEVAQKVAVGLYPRWSITAETAEAARVWETGEHASALKRLVSEGRSSTERALRARAFDAD